MKYEKTKYTKQFDFQIGKEWIGFDVAIEEGDDVDDVFRQVKAKVHQLAGIPASEPLYTAQQPVNQPTPVIQVDKTEELRLEQLISEAPDMEALKSFYLLAVRNDLQGVYDQRFYELQTALQNG